MKASVNGFIDAPRRQFSLYGKGEVCLTTDEIPGICVAGSEGAVSTTGVAACLPAIRPAIPIPVPPFAIIPPRGAGFTFADHDLSIWPIDCYASRYQVADAHATALGDPPSAQSQVTVQGAAGVTFKVTGSGGVPDVDLIGPNGAPVTPDANFPDSTSGTQYLSLKAPAPGVYTVSARAGSPLIADLEISRSEPAPSVTGVAVSGKGRARTLSYNATLAAGQGITFAESGSAGSRVLGAATAGKGKLSFTPGPGPGGRRQILALLMQDGVVKEQVTVGSYTAPSPPRLGLAAGLRARQSGTSVVVTWRPGAAAAAQRLTAAVPGGPLVARILSGKAGRATIPGIDGRKMRVSVIAVDRNGHAGPAVVASLAAAPKKKPAKK